MNASYRRSHYSVARALPPIIPDAPYRYSRNLTVKVGTFLRGRSFGTFTLVDFILASFPFPACVLNIRLAIVARIVLPDR